MQPRGTRPGHIGDVIYNTEARALYEQRSAILITYLILVLVKASVIIPGTCFHLLCLFACVEARFAVLTDQ